MSEVVTADRAEEVHPAGPADATRWGFSRIGDRKGGMSADAGTQAGDQIIAAEEQVRRSSGVIVPRLTLGGRRRAGPPHPTRRSLLRAGQSGSRAGSMRVLKRGQMNFDTREREVL